MSSSLRWRVPGAALAGVTAAILFAGPVGPLGLAGTRPASADEEKKLKTVDEFVKDFEEKHTGFFHVYRDKKRVFLEIPKRELERSFLLATSFSGGTSYAGWQWTDSLLAWERYEDKLLLIERNVQYRADDNTPLHDVVTRTYTDRVVKALTILAEQRGDNERGVLIDLKELAADNARLFFDDLGGSIDSSIARFTKIKVFPTNVELAVTAPTRDNGRLITFHYSLGKLPKTSYSARRADDRVGYFLTAIKDFSKGRPEDDQFVRLINRWDLKKADPKLELSPPVKPIVFYIEKTVPIRFRRFVAEGILEWNRAFEKCGFVDAVVVRQQTETNEFAEFDPEDARYNFFRWITSERAFAMGPSRVNPLTGEIIDADIIMDDSMVRSYLREYETLIKKAPDKFYSRRLLEYVARHPEAHPLYGTRLMPTREELARAVEESMTPPGTGRGPDAAEGDVGGSRLARPRAMRGAECEFGEGISHQIALAGIAMMARGDLKTKGGEYPEEFIGQIIKEVVMHEVGHTLGLRHNFKASTWLALAEIDGNDKPAATVGSVMDYNPIHVNAPGKAQGRYITSTIGPYDFWAIEYGYKQLEDETKGLKEITDRVAEKGLAYATDEDVSSSDPLVNRWDLAADPLDYAKSRKELVAALIPGLADRVVPEGESYERARRAFEMLLWDQAYAGYVVARYVGGQHIHRDHRGDPNGRSPLVIVPVAKQREALAYVCENILSDGAWPLPPELLTKLAAGRWSHWGNNDWQAETAYPVHERVLSMQRLTLALLLGPDTLERIEDAELKLATEEDVLTIPELLTTLTEAIFPELHGDGTKPLDEGKAFTVRKPFTPSLRRNLQRVYLGELISLALGRRTGMPAVTRALAYQQLKALLAALDVVVADKAKAALLDAYSLAHLEETRLRIAKALEATYSAN